MIKRPIPFILPFGERAWLVLSIPDEGTEKVILNNETMLLLSFNAIMAQYMRGAN